MRLLFIGKPVHAANRYLNSIYIQTNITDSIEMSILIALDVLNWRAQMLRDCKTTSQLHERVRYIKAVLGDINDCDH